MSEFDAAIRTLGRLLNAPPQPGAASVLPASVGTPPPLPKTAARPAVRPATLPTGTASPNTQAPFQFKFSMDPAKTAFDRKALLLKNNCLVSLFSCAQITCQYESLNKRTLLTPQAAAALDAPLTKEFGKDPARLAEERYNVARTHCDNSKPPPPPPLSARAKAEDAAAKARLHERLLDPSYEWFSAEDIRPGMFGQMSARKQLQLMGAALLVGAAMTAARFATAAFSFSTTPPDDYFKKPDRS